MKIKKLTLENFRGIRNLELEFHNQLTILVGINGTGKTSILDALAMGLSWLQTRYHINNAKSSSIPNENQVSDKDKTLIGQFIFLADINNNANSTTCGYLITEKAETFSWAVKCSRNEKKGNIDAAGITQFFIQNPDIIPYLVHLPLNRNERFLKDFVEISSSTFEQIIEKKVPVFETLEYVRQNQSRLSNTKSVSITPASNFRDLLTLLYRFQEEEKDKLHEIAGATTTLPPKHDYESSFLQSVIQAWKKLFPETFTYFKVKKDDTGRLYLSIRKKGIDITDTQLSDGEKGLLSLVGAIAVQLSSRTDENALDKPGIILIDEIELHLHPKWQREVVPRLLAVFPNCQFIVTTHSPQVLGGIREGKIVLLSNSEDGNITYKSYEENIFGMSSNDILTSLMGGGERDKDVAGQMKRFYGALENEDIETARTVLEELKKETDIPELEAMGMRLRRKELLKNEIHS